MNTCDVCFLIDGDQTLKPCTYCPKCDAFLCERCQVDPVRRFRAAFLARIGGGYQRAAIALLALLVILGAAAPARAQGPSYPYTVALSCTPPSTGTVTGYNFYRAPFASSACGTFAKLTATPASACSYTDQNPPQGAYCYEATSLDGSEESGPDLMPGQVQVPPPPPTGLGATLAKNGKGYDVQFAWTIPAGPLDAITLYCGGARQAKITPLATGLRLYLEPAGKKTCEVTASSSSGESALSKAVSFTVP